MTRLGWPAEPTAHGEFTSAATEATNHRSAGKS